jgi:hypothetical protein
MMIDLQWLLVYINIAAASALVFRLAMTGLFRLYRWLFVFLTFDVLESVAGAWLRRQPKAYGDLYMTGQSLKLVLAFCVVLELYRLALSDHPALARFGRQTVWYLILGSAVIAGGGLVFDRSLPEGQAWILHQFFSFERTMDTWLAVSLLMISGFIGWFPVIMRQNVALYIGGFMVHFLSRAAGLLLINVMPVRYANALAAGTMIIPLACVLSWLFRLKQEGERQTTVIGHRWDPDAMQRLTGQLDSINANLARLYQR